MKHLVTVFIFSLLSYVVMAEDATVTAVETSVSARPVVLDKYNSITQSEYEALKKSLDDNHPVLDVFTTGAYVLDILNPVTWITAGILTAAGQPTDGLLLDYSKRMKRSDRINLHGIHVRPDEPNTATDVTEAALANAPKVQPAQ